MTDQKFSSGAVWQYVGDKLNKGDLYLLLEYSRHGAAGYRLRNIVRPGWWSDWSTDVEKTFGSCGGIEEFVYVGQMTDLLKGVKLPIQVGQWYKRKDTGEKFIVAATREGYYLVSLKTGMALYPLANTPDEVFSIYRDQYELCK